MLFHLIASISIFYFVGSKYWGVRVSFPQSKQKPGWRYEIFRSASVVFAGYCGYGSAANSIVYIGSTLCVFLLFESEKDAGLFLNSLIEKCGEFDIPFTIDSAIEEISTTVKPARLLLSDYKNDSGSPPQRKKSQSLSSSVSGSFPFAFELKKVQKMLEKPDLEDILAMKSLYKMHIASAALYPRYNKHPDNFIYASHFIHQFFDGLYLPDMKPSIRISCGEEDTRNQMVMEGMTCTWVKILCRDEITARVVMSRLKVGSYQDTDTPLLLHTYVYVEDLRLFKKFSALKALEYDNKWGLGIGADIDEVDIISEDAESDESYMDADGEV